MRHDAAVALARDVRMELVEVQLQRVGRRIKRLGQVQWLQVTAMGGLAAHAADVACLRSEVAVDAARFEGPFATAYLARRAGRDARDASANSIAAELAMRYVVARAGVVAGDRLVTATLNEVTRGARHSDARVWLTREPYRPRRRTGARGRCSGCRSTMPDSVACTLQKILRGTREHLLIERASSRYRPMLPRVASQSTRINYLF